MLGFVFKFREVLCIFDYRTFSTPCANPVRF